MDRKEKLDYIKRAASPANEDCNEGSYGWQVATYALEILEELQAEITQLKNILESNK